MSVTIIDIAKDSNTSKSTVSRYLNGSKVKPVAAKAIEASIKKLDYHQNVNAKRLVTQKSHTIGVILDDISNVYFSEILSGIQSVAGSQGYVSTFYSRASDQKRETDFLSLFREGHIDGLILGTFQKRTPQELEIIAKSEFPIVLIGDNCGSNRINSVDVDNKQGTMDEVEYLYNHGHRKIAYLRGPLKISGAEFRAQGFIEGMHRYGLDSSLILDIEWTVEGGHAAALQILQDTGVTAIICSNDYCAYGALNACRQSGLRVPQDISIVAFDDGPLAKFSIPALTTVKQPFKQLGETAAKQLIGMIQEESPVKASILLQSQFIVRASSGAAQVQPQSESKGETYGS